jgi:mRNA interferase MazF
VEAPAKGAVVLVRFPFSDLSRTKLRPAVVLADAGRGDRVLCQITSKPYGDSAAVVLDDTAFASGSLRVTSYARPGKLFTASSDLMTGQVGLLTPEARTRIVDAVVALMRADIPAALESDLRPDE